MTDDQAQPAPPTEREEQEAIKPCPFCGAKAEYDRIAAPPSDLIGVRIVCTECRAGITTRSGQSGEETEAAALSAWNFRTHSPEKAEANARLIAAAPDLLEALQEVSDHLESVLANLDGVTWREDFPMCVPTIRRARAAIARATEEGTR